MFPERVKLDVPQTLCDDKFDATVGAAIIELDIVATFTVVAPELVKTILPEYVPTLALEASRTYMSVEVKVPVEPTVKEVENPEFELVETSKPVGGVIKIPEVNANPVIEKLVLLDAIPAQVFKADKVPETIIIGLHGVAFRVVPLTLNTPAEIVGTELQYLSKDVVTVNVPEPAFVKLLTD